MMLRPQAWRNWLLVVVFAAGMAWVEAACVYYLRAMVDRLEPYQANPLPMHGVLGPVELVREAATLVMLLAVGGIAGRTRTTRLGYTAIAFGIWDICYYLFLKIICDWPKSLFDWDILFLIPLPWWGPVLAPISIALLMILWGTLVTLDTARDTVTAATSIWWRFNALGTALALCARPHFDVIPQLSKTLRARIEQRGPFVRAAGELGPAHVADHQGMAGQNHPGLWTAALVGHQQ